MTQFHGRIVKVSSIHNRSHARTAAKAIDSSGFVGPAALRRVGRRGSSSGFPVIQVSDTITCTVMHVSVCVLLFAHVNIRVNWRILIIITDNTRL